MQVIAVTSQKGGTGKTTLSGHLAVAAERAGLGPVAVIDADPQASLTNWRKARQADGPRVAAATADSLGQEVTKFRDQGVKLLFIDTPPAITWTIIEAVKLSDLVLIPVRPSPHDLAAAGSTVDLVEDLGKPLVFVVNGASQRAKITAEAAVALSQHGTVAPAIVHNRTDFAGSMIDGRTVMEVRNAGRSAAEIESLWQYVSARLQRGAAAHRAEADAYAPSAVMPQNTEVGAMS